MDLTILNNVDDLIGKTIQNIASYGVDSGNVDIAYLCNNNSLLYIRYHDWHKTCDSYDGYGINVIGRKIITNPMDFNSEIVSQLNLKVGVSL